MSRPKYPCTRADLVKLPNNYTTAQSWDATQIHSNTALDVAIAQIVRGVLNVGNLASLSTTDKTNLVAAINEVKGNIPTSYNELTDKPIVKTSDNGFVIVADGANRANKATAQNAFAEGGKTEAAGTSSHAEGFSTLAEGSSAHAEGQGTEASGTGSHAEGWSTLARGAYSHVEGNYTETVDSSAHAEGVSTVAYGRASHAEGNSMWSDTVVSRAYTAGDLFIYVNRDVNPGFVISNNTQTVGVQICVLQEQDDYKLSLDAAFTEDIAANEVLSVAPSAYGSYSHTEGSFTVAMGDSSHAEGSESKALGDYSHAEGLNTKTTNIAEHASGKFNVSTPNVTQFSVGVGTADNARVNAYEVTTDGKMYVKGVGGYDGTNVTSNNVDDLATAISQAGGVTDYNDLGNVPLLNTEDGGYKTPDATSAGNACLAEGRETEARGAYSHAEGYGSIAASQAHAEGYFTKAEGINSHAEGEHSQAKAGNTHAEGYYTIASTQYSHAEGLRSETHGSAAHAEGNTTRANGDASHAEGESTNANGNYSHAEGRLSTASGTQAHAEGINTIASGDQSHAEGYYTRASAASSHAEGNNSSAAGTNSHAEGESSSAAGTNSHAEGYHSRAAGAQAHASGYYTLAEGENSHAEGYHTTASADNSFVCGTYNKSDDTTLFAVGYGTQSSPKDAVHVDYDGSVYIQGIGRYTGDNLGQSGVESVQEVIARLEQALGGNNS